MFLMLKKCAHSASAAETRYSNFPTRLRVLSVHGDACSRSALFLSESPYSCKSYVFCSNIPRLRLILYKEYTQTLLLLSLKLSVAIGKKLISYSHVFVLGFD